MFLSVEACRELLRGVWAGLSPDNRAEVCYFPPFPLIPASAELLRPTAAPAAPIELGGQNMHWEAEGAFTGEVSPRHLLDVGCRHVLIGHSERRTLFGETDDTVNRKLKSALAHGLRPMVCVGETLSEREGGQTEEVLRRQVEAAFAGIPPGDLDPVTFAYEPVWAIGTGRTATPEMAQAAHAFIRQVAEARVGTTPAQALRILYGGSVKPDNAVGLLGQPDIDGALVGGACLTPPSFLAIIRAVKA